MGILCGMKKSNVSLASVYAPNAVYPRVRFFNDLSKRINENDQWIIGGDFNFNIDNKHKKDTSKLIFSNLLQEKNLSDIWHKLYPNSPGYTHFHHGIKQPSRTDYIVMSSTLCDQIEEIYNNAMVRTVLF